MAVRRRVRARLRDARTRLQRDFLIEAAEHCFAEKGVDGTKMEEVAREAGLSLATIYDLCGGKAGLVGAVHEARLDEMIGQMEAASAGVDAPFDALMAGVRSAVLNFMAHPDYLRINLREGHAWGLKGVKSWLPPVVEESWQRTIDWMAPIFEEGIRRGVFHDDPPELMARRTNAHVQVQMASWLEDPERLTADETIADLEEQLRRAFCRSTARQAP
jgi:AcrR family transcriptional regulator